jgi:bifunctional oligoribonuclease and PAP phosphatase NrnA
MTTPHWIEATLAVERAHRILLVTHVSPDGDAIGSLLGLGNALRLRGKHVDLAVDGGVPDFADFLHGANTVKADIDSGEWELMIALDSSDEQRLGRCGAYGLAHSREIINVDHHPSNTRFGQHHIIMTEAVSTTEILQGWLIRLGVPLSAEIAAPLLTGLLTDTMGFRTDNVRAETFVLANRLVAAGAPYSEIVQRTLNSKGYRAILLWQRVLPSVTLEDGLISAVVRKDDWSAAGYFDETDAGLVAYLIATDEVKIAIVYKDTGSGSIDISMRAKRGYDVGAIAMSLGGGGHKPAAGANLPGSVEEVMARVQPLLRAALKA